MNIPNEPPSSPSSEALCSLKHDFPEEGQPWVASDENAPAPTNSTRFIKSSQQQFAAGGKSMFNKLADEFVVVPQEHTAVAPLDQSKNNQLPCVDGNGDEPTNNGSSTIRGLAKEKTVKHLRLSEALIVPETTTIYEARCHMAANRADVLVLTDSNSLLSGIFTNKDIATRVIAREIDLVTTPVFEVMSKNPIFVLSDTLVVEAVQKMMQGKVTQLPVIENGKVIGLVHLPLCLFDEMANTETRAKTYDRLTEAAVKRVAQRGLTVKQLPADYGTTVPDTTTIYEAWCEMAARELDAVVITGSNVLFSGILTKKDIVSRVIPCGIDVVNTLVSKVITKKPIFVSCDTLPMEAMQKIVQGEVTQLLVRQNVEEDCFVYLPLSLQGKTAENQKVIDSREQSSKPLPGLNVNGALDGTAGPGLTRFVHVTKSPYSNAISDNPVAPPQQQTIVGPTEHLGNPLPAGVDDKGAWDDGTHAPGFTPFVRVNNSPYPDVDPQGKLVAPPPQHTALRRIEQSSNPPSDVHGNNAWNETAAPGFTPFVHVTNSPYPNEISDNSLPGVQGKDDKTINGSSTDMRGLTEEKRVKQFCLSEALTVLETISIYEACCQMAAKGADVLVLTDSSELLTGILTNKDIVTRVIASEIDLVNTPVSKVMTKNPTFVMSDTPVVEALKKLVYEKGVTQFPVIENGKVIGLFDPMGNEVAAGEDYDKDTELSMRMSRGSTVKQLPLQHALTVPETTTIYETCCRMAAGRVEVVVLADSNASMKGILTKKDIISRVIPSGIDFVNTPVLEVMTKNPIFVSCDSLSVETLQETVREYMELLVIEDGEDDDLAYLPLYKCIETGMLSDSDSYGDY